MRICGVDVFFLCGDAVNKISICGVAVISNLRDCNICVFYGVVFSEIKFFVVQWFLV